MTAIDTGILLAAGEGSRLRDVEPLKPLCRVAGTPLIDHALAGFVAAGLTRAIVVLGYGMEEIAAHLAAGDWPLIVDVAHNPDWRRPNGMSLLAAGPLPGGHALLAMCDHLVDPALYERVAAAGAAQGLTLGIDRRLDHDWIDPDDVTRVRTQGDAIVAIGKGLDDYDAHDTGVFAVGSAFIEALAALDSPSITEGVRLLAADGRACVVDCSDLDWIDVDDAVALAKAEAWQAGRAGSG